MSNAKVQELGALTWRVADLLRGRFKQSEYGKVILPFVVLRRLDCALEETKDAVLKTAKNLPKNMDDETRDILLREQVGERAQVYNESKFTFAKIKQQDPKDIHRNLLDYLKGLSDNIRDVFLKKFLFVDWLKRLDDAGLLYQVFDRFVQIDLHPHTISNIEMGYLFEDLIRRFSEISNETAGEHYTPREVIRLMVLLLLANDKPALTSKRGLIRQVYDPAAGTGGMLAIAEMEMRALNEKIEVQLFGQELNPESYAICKSDMLVTGHDPENIAFDNTLTKDAHANSKFHYMLSNPPYGVDWKKYAEPIKHEHATQGASGRFGAGLPRISDGQLLFLQHMISKMRDDKQGSRIGIVMNGSPLFTGGAASGESEIRRWMFENDWVEAIIALPTALFYNTGIQTYVWLLSNRKAAARRGKVQLIDASGDRFWKAMRKSLGDKRREIPPEACEEITRIYADMLNGKGDCGQFSKILKTTDFAYREVRVERPLRLSFTITQAGIDQLKASTAFKNLPRTTAAQDEILLCLTRNLPKGKQWQSREEFLNAIEAALAARCGSPIKKAIVAAFGSRDETAEVCYDTQGNIEPDSDLRDHELVPFNENWQAYFEREVKPFVADAWVDETYVDSKDGAVGRVGYEINFNRYFYQYTPPRPVADIDKELKELESEISELLEGATA